MFLFSGSGSRQKKGKEDAAAAVPRRRRRRRGQKVTLQSAPYCAPQPQEQHTSHPTPVVLVGGDTLRSGWGGVVGI